MYQAVRDPRSNLHFNACLSSIITNGTAWLNFTDAYRALASPSSLVVSALCLYSVTSAPFSPAIRVICLSLVRKDRILSHPLHPLSCSKNREQIHTHTSGSFNYIMYTKDICNLSVAYNFPKCNKH